MDVKNFINELGLTFIRQEGNELIYKCPDCGKDKLYVNKDTGAWQCFHGCGEGHPYQLAKKLKPSMEAGDIFELCGRYGVEQGGSEGNRSVSSKPKKKLIYTRKDVKAPTDAELDTFCAAKGVDKQALAAFQPFRHVREPWMLLPAFTPGNPQAVGIIRVGLQGQLVPIKYKEDGVWKEKLEKYPVAKGSSPGLLGLPRLVEDKPSTIIYAEGWKDALAAIQAGYAATCNSQGAKTWRDEWKAVFKDKIVYIVFDRDVAGVNGAAKAALKIYEVAKEVRIVELPYEVQDKNGKDLHDYLVTDKHGVEAFTNLLSTAPVFYPPLLAPVSEDYQPTEQAEKQGVVILEDDHPDTIAEAFEKHSLLVNDVRHKYNRFDGWSIFRKGKYQRAEDVNEIHLHVRKFIRKCYIRKKDKLVRIKQTSSSIKDILGALAAMPDVHLLPGKKAPCSLDGSLDAQHVIAAKNKLIDISKRPHTTHDVTEQFYTLNYLDYDYDKDAYPDRWASFLADITQSDLDLMLLLQQWCGYLLLPTLKHQKFMLCVGDGANGKGVFFDTVTAALGQSNVSNVPLARFDNPYSLFGTYGKTVNMSNENAKNIESNAESIIKEYVAGDKIVWEQKYKDAFFSYPTAKLMFATNELPRIKDVTDGIWRRMILVPFDAKFMGDNQNTNLAKELQQADELAGILNWMIEGAEILEKEGCFIQPEKCKTALDQYRNESDSARLFVLEHIEDDPGQDVQIPCTWLHQKYQEWCNSNGFKPKNNVHFGRSLMQVHYVQKSRPYFGMKKMNVYVGIKFQEGSEFEQELEKWTA